MSDAENFYRELGGDYDRMTRFSRRLAADRPKIAALVERFGIEAALDVGCGTGVHAFLLAEAGVRVAACDLSEDMLATARARDAERGAGITWQRCAMQDIDQCFPEASVDTVFCLGNSLPHVLSTPAMRQTWAAFAKVLRPGGRVIAQLRNYDRVLRMRWRIVGAHREGDVEFLRFYDFLETGHLRFNVVRMRWEEDRAVCRLESTTLHPWTLEQLTPLIVAAGFDHPLAAANLELGAFNGRDDTDLVLVAARNASATA